MLETETLRQEERNSVVVMASGVYLLVVGKKNLGKMQYLDDQITYFMQTFCPLPTNKCAVLK